MAAVTIMLIVLGAAAPTWRYVMKNDREEELIFRGGQIADAIERYQKKNGERAAGVASTCSSRASSCARPTRTR